MFRQYDHPTSRKITKPAKVKRIYKCNICQEILHDIRALNRHIKNKHSDKEIFTCTRPSEKNPKILCKVTFDRKDNLTRHEKRVHEKIKPFACQYEQCELSFPDDFSLQRHIVAIHEEKKYECSICDKSYSQKGHLSDHMRKEHNVDYA